MEINNRKLRKLIKHPVLYFRDSKLNPWKKVEAIKLNHDLKVVNRNCSKYILPMIHNFGFDFLIEKISEYKTPIVYIEPVDSTLKPSVCVLKENQRQLYADILSMAANEGFLLAYKIDGKVKPFSSSVDLWKDVSSKNVVDIRISTNRILSNIPVSLWFKVQICEEADDYFLFPSANYISRKLWKHTVKGTSIFKNGVFNYKNILSGVHESECDFEVDLVFTWVNSDDPDWKEMYRQYRPESITDASSESRYKSRDELKYALRSWAKYGSFIRNIYVVSNCKPPSWLDLNKNVKWIYHEEIMPSDCLPTFSSHAIEACLHRIFGLSNYFIYSNDDFLLLRPTTKLDFFYPNGIAKIRLEQWGNVNGVATDGEPDYLNGARNSAALLYKTFNKVPTQLHTHSPQSMRVDLLQEINELYKEDVLRTVFNKFRKFDDVAVTGFLYHHYAIMSGHALESNTPTMLIQQNHNFKARFIELQKLNQTNKFTDLPLSVCINDGANSHLNDEWNSSVQIFLDSIFHEKSIYEV